MMLRDKNIDESRKEIVAPLSVGVTWVDGQVIFRDDRKWAKAFFALCHYSESVFLLTPKDWIKATTITTIAVSPLEKYCERGYMCLDFDCKFNIFNRDLFSKEFDSGSFTLGLPLDIGSKTLWFNTPKYKNIWKQLLMKPHGGILQFSEEKLRQWEEENSIIH